MTPGGLAQRMAMSEAIAQIWRSSADQANWLNALRAIRALFPRTIGGTLYTPFLQEQPGSLWVNLDPPAGLMEAYGSHYADKDIVLHALLRRLPSDGFVFTESDSLPKEVLLASEVYNGWMVPFGITKAIGAVVHATGQEATLLSMAGDGWRVKEAASYRRVMEELRPHLHGAVAAHWRLVRAESQVKISRYALDELSLGIAWLGADGRIIHANRTALAILEANDGLKIVAGKMTAVLAKDANKLSAAIKRFGKGYASGEHGERFVDAIIAVARPSGRESYVVSIVPAVADVTGMSGDAIEVVAFLSDPLTLPTRIRSRLSELYGLTKSEAEVAEELTRGAGIEELARRRGVTMNTVRTQLKSLMGKLGAARQSDVVRAVMTLGSLGGGGNASASDR